MGFDSDALVARNVYVVIENFIRYFLMSKADQQFDLAVFRRGVGIRFIHLGGTTLVK